MNKQPNAEPNQTEAEKLLEKVCPVLFKPSTDVKKAILAAMEEYASLARKQVIEEIEGYINQCNNGISISLLDFKTYLQTLKK